jgi:hypothetical protein
MPRQLQCSGPDDDLLVATVRWSRRGAGEQIAYLLVGGFREVLVPLADGGQPTRRERAGDLVGGGAQLGDDLRRRDGDGEDHPGRAAGAGHLTGRSGRGAGGHAVVDDQRGTPGQVHRRPVAAQQTCSAPQDIALPCLDGSEFVGGHPGHPDHILVDDPGTPFADGTHAQLRLVGDAELAYHDHVQRGRERLSDLERNHDAAPRQAEDHQVRPAEMAHQARQLAPRIDPVGECHRRRLPPCAALYPSFIVAPTAVADTGERPGLSPLPATAQYEGCSIRPRWSRL